jgi:hypothetical protein
MSDDIDLADFWGGTLLPKETAKPSPLPAGTNDTLDAWIGYELAISKPEVGPRCECGGQIADSNNNLHKEYCPVYGNVTLREDQK